MKSLTFITLEIRKLIIGIGAILIICGFLAAVLTLGKAVGETVIGNLAREKDRIEREKVMLEQADKMNANQELTLGKSSTPNNLINQSIYNPQDFDLGKAVLSPQASTNLEQLPSLMRGEIPTQTLASTSGKPKRKTPPRMCEMPEDYFETLDDFNKPMMPEYLKDNSYIRRYKHRRGFLNEREMVAAKVAWGYFAKFTQETTGLANSVGRYGDQRIRSKSLIRAL